VKACALGRPCRHARLPTATGPEVFSGTYDDLVAHMESDWTPAPSAPPRPVTAGTYRSPERPAKDHSARETRRTLAKAEAARRRAARDRGLGTVRRLIGKTKGAPTPKRDTVRQDRFGAR